MHARSEQNHVATVLKWRASGRFAKKASINAVGVVQFENSRGLQDFLSLPVCSLREYYNKTIIEFPPLLNILPEVRIFHEAEGREKYQHRRVE